MSASDFVVLKGGLVVPLPAVELALDLERRGIELWIEDGDALCVGPPDHLTDEDRAALRRWKPHVLALLTYVPKAAPYLKVVDMSPMRPPFGHPKENRQVRDRTHGSRTVRGYDEPWQRLRNWFIRRPENILCHKCEAEGFVKLAREVDHIIPFRNRQDPLRLDPRNLQSLCVRHHREKHRRAQHAEMPNPPNRPKP